MNKQFSSVALVYNKYQSWINLLILILLPVIVFYNSLNAYFVAYDEYGWLLHIKQNFFDIFKSNLHDNYRPFEILSHVMDITLYGDENPLGRHVTNLLIHIFNVILLYLIGSNLSKKKVVGLIAGLIFAVHFIHGYSFSPVTWIPGRTDLLVALFCLLSFYLFLSFFNKRSHPIYLLFSILSFAMALLSKEMAVTFPAIIALYLILNTKDIKDQGQAISKTILYLFSFFVICGIAMILAGIIFNPRFVSRYFSHDHLLEQTTVLTIKRILFILIIGGGLLVCCSILFLILIKLSAKSRSFILKIAYSIPYFFILFVYIIIRSIVVAKVTGSNGNLSFRLGIDTFVRDMYGLFGLICPLGNEYNNFIFNLEIYSTISFYILFLLLSILVLFIFYKLSKSHFKILIFCFLWIFITIMPVHNAIVSLHQFQQRYLYLPLAGFCLFISLLINHLMQSRNNVHLFSIILNGSIITIIIISSLLIFNRNNQIKESGLILHNLSSDLSNYPEIFQNSSIYFVTFPMDPLNSSSAVWVNSYMNDILNYIDNKDKNNKLYDWNIFMYCNEEEGKINLTWTNKNNINLNIADPDDYLLIPKEPTELDKKRGNIYNYLSSNLIEDIPSLKNGKNFCKVYNVNDKRISININKPNKEFLIFINLKQLLKNGKKSYFFLYESHHFKLIKILG